MDQSQVSFLFVLILFPFSLSQVPYVGWLLVLVTQCPVLSYVEANMYELVTSLFSLLPLSLSGVCCACPAFPLG